MHNPVIGRGLPADELQVVSAADRKERRKAKSPDRVARVAIVGAIAATCLLFAEKIKSAINQGTEISLISEGQPGREKIRVDHHFQGAQERYEAIRSAEKVVLERPREFLIYEDTIKVESFDGNFFGKHRIVFTADAESKDQARVEQIVERENARAEAKPVDVEPGGDGTFVFNVIKPQLHSDIIIGKTITKFREEHSGMNFTVVNVPNQNGEYSEKAFYQIVPTARKESK
jgi:hypothetical protein